MSWDQNQVEPEPGKDEPRVPVALEEIQDGRCKASSWRVKKPSKPTYENHFGPGGYNRCTGDEGHANQFHRDEWGYVFRDYPFKVIRIEADLL